MAALAEYNEGDYLGGQKLDERLDQLERFLKEHFSNGTGGEQT